MEQGTEILNFCGQDIKGQGAKLGHKIALGEISQELPDEF